MSIRVGVMEKVLRQPTEQAFRTARQLGFDGVELEVRGSPEALRAEAEAAGLRICSLICDGDGLGSEISEERLIARERLLQALRDAADLKADGILLPHFGFSDLEHGPLVKRFAEDVAACVPAAEALEVTIAWENALDAEDTCAVIEWVDSPRFRCYYDFANGAKRGADPAQELRAVGEQVYRVHAKNLNRQPLDAPGVDLRACLQALHERGYSGWVVLETAPGEDAVESARHNLRVVRETWDALG